MKFRFVLFLVLASLGFAFTQLATDGCEPYFPLEKGITWEYQELDKKGEVSGYTKTTVENVSPEGAGIKYDLKAITDGPKKKEKNHHETELSYVCEDGVLKIDLESLIPQETRESMESMEITMTQSEIMIPKTLNAGDKLNDGNVHMTASTNGIKVMDMTVNITDRKVEKIEEVTTPAGTYSCALITYKTSTKMGFVNATNTSKDWYSSKVGIVKSETYDKNGKLSGSRILTGYSK
ncbi:MAG: hypothetical protein ABJG68_16935 [Crocinitomicaceae bacterium]